MTSIDAMQKLVLDIETYPIDDAETYLGTEDFAAPGNYTRPEAIATYVANAKRKAIDRCGLDPDLGKIIAIGWMLEGRDGEPHVKLCQDERAERLALIEVWREVVLPTGAHRAIVSFNGLRFDLPYIMRRSLYLDVLAPSLNIDKFRSPHVDLMARLSFNGVLASHSLAFYAKRFGLITEYPDVNGSMIAQLVADGEWDEIRRHCASDVQLTYDLAARLKYIEFDEDAYNNAQAVGL